MPCDLCKEELTEERLREVRDKRYYLVICKLCEDAMRKTLSKGTAAT